MASADHLDSYFAGLILLEATPYTGPVFVWSHLAGGAPSFHAAPDWPLNDTILVFAFAPEVGLLLDLSAITVPWDPLLVHRSGRHGDQGDDHDALRQTMKTCP